MIAKKDIASRDDIYMLVTTFYNKVQNNAALAPFFSVIDDWKAHYNHLTTFWESNLFLKTKYLGNPLAVHVEVDKQNHNAISQAHFGIWLNLWFETVDELFAGERANNAKFRARKMSTFMYLNIFKSR